MLFNSHVFLLVFLPLALLGWWGLRTRPALRLGLLTGASYVFYGYWDPRFTLLMLASTLVDYVAGARIARAEEAGPRRFWLGLSLTTNLGLLAFFKYAGFFARTLNALVADSVPVWDIVLPVGISFYTFQSMSYSIDIYREDAKPATSLLHFAAYVSMFPQLVAGPIVRYAEIEAQLRALKSRIDAETVARGLHFFVLGLAKKVLIADVIAARLQFHDAARFGLLDAWTNVLGYTAQIYFDFSGYSEMAVGLGIWLGFELPKNFDSPYKAKDASDFWRRWHITLSEWLRDYLYIPLGGNRGGRRGTSATS